MKLHRSIFKDVYAAPASALTKRIMAHDRKGVTGKTARTLISFVMLALLPYVIPGLAHYRLFFPARAGGSTEFADGLARGGDQDEGRTDRSGQAARAIHVEEGKPGEIEDPSGQALTHFFAALLLMETKGGRVRICHYGDSPITNDGITSTVRRELQLKFGDAGHGFVLIAKPWGWYGHEGVIQDAGPGWDIEPMFISRGDHRYGLGGASFVSRSGGATASFATAEDGDLGRSVTSFDIYYLAQPGGGDLRIDVDGKPSSQFSTASDQTRSGFHDVPVSPGPHKMTLTTTGNGEVRLFGVTLETGERGVGYDSLGVNGAFVGLLAHYMDEQHWIEQLRHRAPDLVVINYGTNESEFEKLPMAQYEADTSEVIRRLRAALPNASILFVSPMDRGTRGAGGEIVTRAMIPRLVSYQRRIAGANGCAFFDTFTAMGGEGTVARWCKVRPRLMGGDFTHPTSRGAEIVGDLIFKALANAYDKYKESAGMLAGNQRQKPGTLSQSTHSPPN